MFTSENFRHYIELINVNLQCPCCKKNEWAYYAESRMLEGEDRTPSSDPDKNAIAGLVALTADRNGRITNARLGGIGCAQMLCLNCGYQLLFNYHFARTRYLELTNSVKINGDGDGN